MKKTEYIISVRHPSGDVQMLCGHCAASESATCLFTNDPGRAIKSSNKYTLLVWYPLLKSHIAKTGMRLAAVVHPIDDAPIWD